jgi:hypothetical protein
VFTLCYNLDDPRLIFQRYPGVEGSAYFIGGLGVNYQQTENIVLAPIRAAWASGSAPTSATWPTPDPQPLPVLGVEARAHPLGGGVEEAATGDVD